MSLVNSEQQGGSRRSTDRCRTIMMRQPQSLRRHRVQLRGEMPWLVAICRRGPLRLKKRAYVAIAEVIAENENDVRSRR